MPFVYMVRCKDGTLYTGWSVDVEARVRTHNAGRGARYTKTRRPVKLIYSEEVATRGEALRRERAIKRLRRPQKLALAQQGNAKRPPAKKSRREKFA